MLRQMLPLLPKDAIIVSDNGAYSKDDAKMLDSNGFGFVTRLQLNAAGCRSVKAHVGDSISIDDDVSYFKTEGNLGRTIHLQERRAPRRHRPSLSCKGEARLGRDADD